MKTTNETTTWYETGGSRIAPVQMVSRTDKFIVVVRMGENRRYAIETDYHCFKPTWDEAKAWIVAKRESELHAAHATVAYRQRALRDAKSLTQPTKRTDENLE